MLAPVPVCRIVYGYVYTCCTGHRIYRATQGPPLAVLHITFRPWLSSALGRVCVFGAWARLRQRPHALPEQAAGRNRCLTGQTYLCALPSYPLRLLGAAAAGATALIRAAPASRRASSGAPPPPFRSRHA
eukprot:scaffold9918_cov123-Isochrysis_galbana.AAC.2